jgi:hypothetical protein
MLLPFRLRVHSSRDSPACYGLAADRTLHMTLRCPGLVADPCPAPLTPAPPRFALKEGITGLRPTSRPRSAEVSGDPAPDREGAKDMGLLSPPSRAEVKGSPSLVKKPRNAVPRGQAALATLPVTLHSVPSCQKHRHHLRSTSGPGSAPTRLPAIAMHYGSPFQSFEAHRTGSASETVCDRTALGETDAK